MSDRHSIRSVPFYPLALALWWLLSSSTGSKAGPMAPTDLSPDSQPGLLFAVEDTLDLTDRYRIDPLQVQADRLKIREIVNRCIEREEELASQIESQVFTQFAKVVLHVGGYEDEAEKLLVSEEVDRVYLRNPDEIKVVPLRMDRYILEKGERKPWDDETEEGDGVMVTHDDFNDLPFYLEDRDDYDFHILSREIVGNRVVYEVRLSPKSDFEIAPGGRVWVDTSNFQILREEFDFGDRVPMPLMVKSIGPFIRERERIGDLWVWSRIMIRADLRIGWMRFLNDKIPDTAEIVIVFQDYLLNQGWPALPTEKGSGE